MIGKLPSWLALALLLSGTRVSANEPKYWVSEHFQEKINVNYNISDHNYYINESIDRKRGNSILRFAPSILDLSKLDWSKEQDGNIRLCFDNRPLHLARDGRTSSKSAWKDFCSHYDQNLNSNDPSLENSPFYGMRARRVRDGKFVCEAVFTLRSFFSFLAAQQDLVPNGEVKISRVYPYWASSYPFLEDKNIRKYLIGQDEVSVRWTTGGSQVYSKIILNKTWECLLPAYRMYWREVLSSCNSFVGELKENPGTKEFYDPLLSRLGSEIIRSTDKCAQQ